MKVPHYIPIDARDVLLFRLQGAAQMRNLWASEIAKIDNDLAAFEKEDEKSVEQAAMIETYIRARAAAVDSVNQLDKVEACCKRLLYDKKMQDAYAQLTLAKLSASHVRVFLHSAIQAAFDYEEHRKWLQQAREKAVKVKKKAEDLSTALLEFEEHTIWNCPKELESIAGLINHLENRHVLDEGGASELRLSKLASEIGSLAAKFEPKEAAWLTVARKSRESNKKQDYLRAITHLLFHEEQLPRSPALMKAIATSAEVVIDDPNIVIDYDDVRKIKI